MTEQFTRAFIKFSLIMTGILAAVFIGAGILILLDPALIVSIFLYAAAGGFLLAGGALLLPLLRAIIGA